MVWVAVGLIVLGTLVAICSVILSSSIGRLMGERSRMVHAESALAYAARERDACLARAGDEAGRRELEGAERRLAFAREAKEQAAAHWEDAKRSRRVAARVLGVAGSASRAPADEGESA